MVVGEGHYSMHHTVPGSKQVALALRGQWAGAREALPTGTRESGSLSTCRDGAGGDKEPGWPVLLCMQLCHARMTQATKFTHGRAEGAPGT